MQITYIKDLYLPNFSQLFMAETCVYENPDGLTSCCNVLAVLCKDAKGTKYKEELKPIESFSGDPIYDLFSDMGKREKKEMYINIWRKRND